jgi:ribokinase
MRVAVVGHVEWVEFLDVPHVPAAGEIVQAESRLSVPAGGGAVAAAALARFGAETHFFTALGDDTLGHRAEAELRARGVDVHVAFRPEPQRRAITFVDAKRERTIVTIGGRHVPNGGDDLPWDVLESCDAVYVTGGDPRAVRHARRARTMVGTSRVLSIFQGTQLDALVGSANDPGERYADGDLDPAPKLVVRTEGERGGHWIDDGSTKRWTAVRTEVTGDTYGAGDTFAAAITLALGAGKIPADAFEFAAERAAEVVTFVGPYPLIMRFDADLRR